MSTFNVTLSSLDADGQVTGFANATVRPLGEVNGMKFATVDYGIGKPQTKSLDWLEKRNMANVEIDEREETLKAIDESLSKMFTK